MTCHEIAKQLPSYQEDALPPDDKKSIEDHLASCLECRRALADLKKATGIIRDLGEVEPPPFFEQRIMSRVREEAGKKRSIFRMFFYPLHVKIPLQAVSTLFVVVLALSLYHHGEPEMKHLASPPGPLAELGKGQVTAESPPASSDPSVGIQAGQTSPGKPFEMDRQQFVSPPPENVGQAGRMENPPGRVREGSSSAMKSLSPRMAKEQGDLAPIRAGSSGKEQAGTQESGMTPETLLPELKRKDQMAEIGAAGESKKMPAAPLLSPLKAAATMKHSTMDLTIQVRDMPVAVREIEKRLDQAGALVMERQRHERGESLKAEIPAQNIAVFLERLEAIGRTEGEKRPLADPEGKVTVILKIVVNP